MPLWRPGLLRRKGRSDDRLPPGQRLVRGWPVLHEGPTPTFDVQSWRFRVWGAVESELALDWAAFGALPRFETTQDFHCVTTWSRYDNRWGGVSVQTVLDQVKPTAAATHVLVHCFDSIGYTTNLTLEDFSRPQNLLATHHDGAPLTSDHGGPLRLVVHHLYAWKSAKWVCGIEFRTENQRSFWEQRGYHNRADPWLEERFSYQEDAD